MRDKKKKRCSPPPAQQDGDLGGQTEDGMVSFFFIVHMVYLLWFIWPLMSSTVWELPQRTRISSQHASETCRTILVPHIHILRLSTLRAREQHPLRRWLSLPISGYRQLTSTSSRSAPDYQSPKLTPLQPLVHQRPSLLNMQSYWRSTLGRPSRRSAQQGLHSRPGRPLPLRTLLSSYLAQGRRASQQKMFMSRARRLRRSKMFLRRQQ